LKLTRINNKEGEKLMTRKIFILISLMLTVAFVLTACAPQVSQPIATPPTAVPDTAVPPTEVPPTEVPPTEVPPTEVPPTEVPAEPVTVEWWHITTQDPGKALWQTMADEYMAANPNVKINITVLENEAFKTKLTSVMQGGTPPDIFQSWGGGVMNDQANAGMLQDITSFLDADGGAWRNTFAPGALAVYALDGKNYGVPWDMGMVGWWYNKDLFTQANIAQPPATWTELLEDVKILKAAGITPIALGEKDTWTGMHIWSYLATRICGKDGFLAAANRTGSFTDACFVEAGVKLQELIALEPFQAGFLGASHDEMQGTFGNGKAAMELSGQWAPSVESAQAADKVGVKNLGFFNFPAVEGGAGALTDAMGGGNGFAIGKNASPEAVDFVKYLTNVAQQTRVAEIAAGIPVVKGAEAGLKDPNMLAVQQGFAAAEYFQLYYDQYMPSAMGSIINEAVAGLFAGTMTPEQVAQAIEDGAKQVFGK
jgi:raffinose/stachyose/melibiose transport system substrate-binding protein